MADSKLAGILGLCRRAGKLTLGYDMTIEAMQKGKTFLVLVASDGAERTLRGINFCAEETGTEVSALPLTKDEISFAVGKRAGVLGVCDRGFSNKIEELLNTIREARVTGGNL